jgi:hypothetical protein
MKKIIFVLIINSILSIGYTQIYSNYEAKDYLRKWGVSSSKIIEDAEIITIDSGSISGEGGLCLSLPILEFINQNQIVLFDGASGYITKKGTIVIEAESLYISAVVINIENKKYFVVGKSLKDIVNNLLE